MADTEAQNDYDIGLRILARWIARAHLKELAQRKSLEKPTLENQITGGNDLFDQVTIQKEHPQNCQIKRSKAVANKAR